jgi:hypothetical protein
MVCVIVGAVIIVLALVVFEWRSWNKPLPPGLSGQTHVPGSEQSGGNDVGT